MVDQDLRTLERAMREAPDDTDARVRWLRARVRAGRLSEQRLHAAARLGDPAARVAHGLVPHLSLLDPWSNHRDRVEILALLPRLHVLRMALAWTRRALQLPLVQRLSAPRVRRPLGDDGGEVIPMRNFWRRLDEAVECARTCAAIGTYPDCAGDEMEAARVAAGEIQPYATSDPLGVVAKLCGEIASVAGMPEEKSKPRYPYDHNVSASQVAFVAALLHDLDAVHPGVAVVPRPLRIQTDAGRAALDRQARQVVACLLAD